MRGWTGLREKRWSVEGPNRVAEMMRLREKRWSVDRIELREVRYRTVMVVIPGATGNYTGLREKWWSVEGPSRVAVSAIQNCDEG